MIHSKPCAILLASLPKNKALSFIDKMPSELSVSIKKDYLSIIKVIKPNSLSTNKAKLLSKHYIDIRGDTSELQIPSSIRSVLECDLNKTTTLISKEKQQLAKILIEGYARE